MDCKRLQEEEEIIKLKPKQIFAEPYFDSVNLPISTLKIDENTDYNLVCKVYKI